MPYIEDTNEGLRYIKTTTPERLESGLIKLVKEYIIANELNEPDISMLGILEKLKKGKTYK